MYQMKKLYVIPSKTVPQGLSALLAFNPSGDVKTNKAAMKEALQHVKPDKLPLLSVILKSMV